MPNCAAPNCTNRSNEENGKNKTFHKLPAEPRKLFEKTKSGKLRFKQQYSKVTQLWVVKIIREPKDRVYIQDLMDEVIYIQTTKEIYHMPKLINIPKTIAQIERPDKDEAIKNVRTRFSF